MDDQERITLSELEMPGDFIRRHIGLDKDQLKEMLEELDMSHWMMSLIELSRRIS